MVVFRTARGRLSTAKLVATFMDVCVAFLTSNSHLTNVWESAQTTEKQLTTKSLRTANLKKDSATRNAKLKRTVNDAECNASNVREGEVCKGITNFNIRT